MAGKLKTEEKIALMKEQKKSIIDYLAEELKINADALKAYDPVNNPIQEGDAKIREMREVEAIKLRDRIHELTRHIAVINRM